MEWDLGGAGHPETLEGCPCSILRSVRRIARTPRAASDVACRALAIRHTGRSGTTSDSSRNSGAWPSGAGTSRCARRGNAPSTGSCGRTTPSVRIKVLVSAAAASRAAWDVGGGVSLFTTTLGRQKYQHRCGLNSLGVASDRLNSIPTVPSFDAGQPCRLHGADYFFARPTMSEPCT